MAQQQGSNVSIIYQAEPAFKTTPTSGEAQILPFVSESFRLNRNLISSNTIRSSRNPQSPVRGNMDVTGDLNFELAPQYGRLFRHIFGYYESAASGEAYQHIFKIGQLPEGLCLEKRFTDLAVAKYFKYNGCRVNSFRMSAKSEGFVDCTVSLMGAKETVGNSSFNASVTDLGHTPFDGFECTLKQGGVSVGIATQIDITLENNLDGNTYVIDGTGERYSMPAGRAKVSGTLTCLFESTTMYELAVANTETSLELIFTKGTGAGTSGNERLTFYLPEIKFQPQAPVVGGPQGVVVELPFEAYYNDDAQASALRAVLGSSTSVY